jgi:hypothetical protein
MANRMTIVMMITGMSVFPVGEVLSLCLSSGQKQKKTDFYQKVGQVEPAVICVL